MWWPDQKLEIKPAKFNIGAHVIWTDNDGGTHPGTVISSKFKTLNSGYQYGIRLAEPYKGVSNALAHEKSVAADPAYPVEKKTTRKRNTKKDTEPSAE